MPAFGVSIVSTVVEAILQEAQKALNEILDDVKKLDGFKSVSFQVDVGCTGRALS